MRRWVRRGVVTSHFVEWQGTPVKSVKTGFRHAVKLAGLWGKVTPHTLRHTAATWLMQRGVPIWQAAGYLGMSAEMIERTYGHHHPDYSAPPRRPLPRNNRRTFHWLFHWLSQKRAQPNSEKPNVFMVGPGGRKP